MIPYSTDAPLYHWPIATTALILLNALLYFAVPSSQLQLHTTRAVQRDPAAFNPFVPPGEDDADRVVADADWGADAFHIVEEPPSVAADGDGSGADVAANIGQPPARLADGRQAAQAEPVAHRGRPQTPTTLTLALEHGVGLKPWQWISSLFLHAGFVQLLLNLLALWAFGLIVEGKVGAWMLLAIYLGIGIAQAALEQTLTLWASPSVSMGANAALLGLLGVAIVWAPRNEFDVFWAFGVRGGSIEIPVLMFGFIQLAMELIGVAFGGFGITSSLMHLVGLAMGLAVGAIWLRRGWVDCEGWDLVSVWHGRETGIARDEQVEAEARALVRDSVRDRDSRPSRTAAPPVAPPTHAASRPASGPPPRAAAKALPKVARRAKPNKTAPATATPPLPLSQQRLQVVERAIAEGNVPVALKLYAKLQVSHPEVQLPQAALFGLIKALLKAKDYRLAIPLLREHIGRFSEQRISLQFNLAQLLIYLQQPRKGLEVLRSMQPDGLDAAQRGTWQNLAQHAQHQIDEGILEVSE